MKGTVNRSLLGMALLTGITMVLAESGCMPLSRMLEKGISGKLPSLLGPAESYDVRVLETGSLSLARGRINRIDIDGKKVRAKGMPVVRNLSISAFGIDADVKKRSIRSVDKTAIRLEVDDADLRDFLRTRYDKEVDIDIDGRNISLATVRNIRGLNLRLEADGALVLRNDHQVDFKISALKVSKLPVPIALASMILESFNPVFDTSDLPFPVRLQEITLQPSTLVIAGEAEDYWKGF